jgi:hypothetical protein
MRRSCDRRGRCASEWIEGSVAAVETLLKSCGMHTDGKPLDRKTKTKKTKKKKEKKKGGEK